MAANLTSVIESLANQFAQGIMSALRGASLEELTRAGTGSAAKAPAPRGRGAVAKKAAPAPASHAGGRLARRSADDIDAAVERITSLLAQHPDGLRAEQIRTELRLAAKELPRPIAEALASKKITKKGQKRATTYFAKASKGKRSN